MEAVTRRDRLAVSFRRKPVLVAWSGMMFAVGGCAQLLRILVG